MSGLILGFLSCSVVGTMMYLDQCYKLAMLNAFGAGMCFIQLVGNILINIF